MTNSIGKAKFISSKNRKARWISSRLFLLINVISFYFLRVRSHHIIYPVAGKITPRIQTSKPIIFEGIPQMEAM
jgi:hypothetical protein